jgi:hypothetical protein
VGCSPPTSEKVQSRLPDRYHYPADLEAPIPFEQSIRDEIEWAVDAGHLPARYRPR